MIKYQIVFWGQHIKWVSLQKELDHGITTFE